jgi:hypothetical protein
MTTIAGQREVELKFDTFPQVIHSRLQQRITEITESLRARAEAAAPRGAGPVHKGHGRLHTEISARIYNSENRIAGYVSVYAPGLADEYAKAATLEYGSNKPRHAVERVVGRMGRTRRRILDRISRPVHIEAFRYLRGPFDEMAPGIQADLESVVAEAASE